jgi:3-dehydroquinate synthase
MNRFEEIRFSAQVEIDYPNHVRRGAAEELGCLLNRWIPTTRPLLVVADETVASLYWQRVQPALAAGGWASVPLLTFPPGEQSKSRQTANDLIDRMLDLGIHRRAVVIALGGGVVCDTVGYVAATYMRGIDYVNVPTSLIGQVDAAIGGKVGINHPRSKNFIGAFHHPLATVIDPEFLLTLPADEIRNGLAEAIKIAMIRDLGLFELLEEESSRLLDPAASRMGRIIATSIKGKIDLLSPDPFEDDLRRVLNFGHTFAHPLEVEGEYQHLRHGYAVAIGMCIASRVALRRGVFPRAEYLRLIRLLRGLGLPTQAPRFALDHVWRHAAIVRHIRADSLNFVIPTTIGEVAIVNDLDFEEFRDAFLEIDRQPPVAEGAGA